MAKNQAAQGKRYELEVRRILEKEGWEVEQAINKTIWVGPGKIISVAHDFFGLFDLMAVRNSSPAILFVQVTVWEKIAPRINKIKAGSPAWKEIPCAIYARIRNGRQAHYRVLHNVDDFKWVGGTAMVIKK